MLLPAILHIQHTVVSSAVSRCCVGLHAASFVAQFWRWNDVFIFFSVAKL